MNGINKYGTQSRLNSELRLLRSTRIRGLSLEFVTTSVKRHAEVRFDLSAPCERQVQRLSMLTFNRLAAFTHDCRFALYHLLVFTRKVNKKSLNLTVFNKNYDFQIACLVFYDSHNIRRRCKYWRQNVSVLLALKMLSLGKALAIHFNLKPTPEIFGNLYFENLTDFRAKPRYQASNFHLECSNNHKSQHNWR